MGGANRADRYRLLMGESCVEGVVARVGLLRVNLGCSTLGSE